MTAGPSRIPQPWHDREDRQAGSPGDRTRDGGAGTKPVGEVRLSGQPPRYAGDQCRTAEHRDDLDSELHAVRELDRDQLGARWRQIHYRDPPPRLSRELMIRAICYSIQVEAHGGLDRRARRRLQQLVTEMQSGKAPLEMPSRIKPGTRLIREWHGEIHEVLVLEEGLAFRGRVHRSLTAIAREITGTSWNGHAFFGLRRRGKRAASNDDVSGGAQPTQGAHAVSESDDG